MKHIIYTQRVDLIQSYRERRDATDQNIPKFLKACGYLPIPIMNDVSVVDAFCDEVSADGFFLSGGNNLAAYGGDAPERDETEKRLIEYAIKKDIPLFGICRGMQFILYYFGTNLSNIENHVRKEHAINGVITRSKVNSFHGMGALKAEQPMEVLARADDGVVEAVQHTIYKIAGIMWHPERVAGFSREDIKMIRNFFEGGTLY